jgi:hypothetical protein
MATKITEQLLTMIRPHWDLPIRTPLDTTTVLFTHQGPHRTHHIRIPLEMGGLKEIWSRGIRSRTAPGIAQMREMDSRPVSFDKSRPIKICGNAQGSGAKRRAIGRQIHRV